MKYVIPATALSWLILMLIVWRGHTPRWLGVVLMGLYAVFMAGSVMLGFRL